MNIKYLTLLLTLTQLTIPWGESLRQYWPWSRYNQVKQPNGGHQAATQKTIRPSFGSRTYNYIKNTPGRLCILYYCRSQWNNYLQNRKQYEKAINNDPDGYYYNLYLTASEHLVNCASPNCSRYMRKTF
jgi:hypothetical protein